MRRKSRPFYIWLTIFFFLPVIFPVKASAAPDELAQISASSYVLMDADSGKILASRNAHLRLPPASMTKLMTLLLAFQAIEQGKAHKTDRVTASKKASLMDGTRIYLEPGEVMSLEEMLISMVLASANDASIAVAEDLAGSEDKFVQLMNQEAKTLGMKNSAFKNVSGMPADDHYSSAYDMAVLARYTISSTDILKYSSLKQYSLRDGTFPIYNGNKLLWRYPGADGLKNGYTSKARNCLTATAKRGNLRLIAVVMGCPLRGGQTTDAATLLDYGFNHYSSASLIRAGKVFASLPVKGGEAESVKAVVNADIAGIYPKADGISFTFRPHLPAQVEAPVKKGQKLGELQVLYQGKTLKSVDLLAAESINRLSLAGRIWRIHWAIKIPVFIILLLYGIRYFNMFRNKRRRAKMQPTVYFRYTGETYDNNRRNRR